MNSLPRYTLSEVAHHCEQDSCWIIVSELVYDVTQFLREHPGGEDIILEHAGTDATAAFLDKGHSKDGVEMLQDYLVGQLQEGQRRLSVRSTGGT